MNHIEIGDGIRLDIDRLRETRMMVQASSGAGKSNVVRLISERLLDAGQQVVIIDREGEFSTLREKFDLLVIGKGGDIPADIRSAGMLAVRLLELGASAVVDLFDMEKQDRRAFVKAFLSAMHDAPKDKWRDIFVVIDEAHDFCSEDGKYASAETVENLMGQGRKRGYCGILVTLRLSKLSKDAAAEANNVLVGRTTLDVDLKRAGDALGFAKPRWEEIKGLARGEFFAFGPAFSFEGVQKIKANKAITSPPPKGPQRGHAKPARASVAVKKIVGELADIAERSKVEIVDLDAAKHKIGELEDLLGKCNQMLADAQARATEHEERGPCERCVELERDIGRVTAQRHLAHGAIAEIKRITRNYDEENQQEAAKDLEAHASIAVRTDRPVRRGDLVFQDPASIPKPGWRPPVPRSISSDAPDSLKLRSAGAPTVGHKRILDAIAWFNALGIEHPSKGAVAGMAGASPTSGTYGGNLAELKRSGMIDYPTAGTLALTETGRLSAERPRRIGTLADLHAAWMQCRSLSDSMKSILAVVISLGERKSIMSKDALADAVGSSRTSGTYGGNLADLKALGLIDYPKPGMVSASSLLFPEGLR